jgi:hypothetical protein
LAQWGALALSVALAPSMLWHTYWLIRLSVIYRGRAGPLVWCVLQHGRAQVAFEVYRDLWARAARRLPRRGPGIFLADRGFADTELMAHLRRLGWHWRIRITASLWLSRRGGPRCKVERISGGRGHACCWPQVCITDKRLGPGHLAVARHRDSPERW